MADDFYGFEEESFEEKGRDNLFFWTVFILLLIGVAFACWLGSFYVFGHPENPRAYQLLTKLKKIDAPKRFEVTAAPPGEFLSSQKLFERYSQDKTLQLEQENNELLRNYIKNYRETKKLVPYITGRFNIINTYELKAGDMFDSGVVALAQSIDFPQVLIEHIYPAAQENVSTLRTMLQTGLDMKIERTNDLSAVIHVEKIYDGRLQFTLVPLLYGTYALKQGVGTFSLEPPEVLNMAAGVPVIKEQSLKDALVAYIRFRRSRGVADLSPNQKVETMGPELVRVDTVEPGTKVPETGALPAPSVATPIPLAGRGPAKVSDAPTPRVNVAMLATPPPRPASTPMPAATPFVAATPLPAATPARVAMATPLPLAPTPAPLAQPPEPPRVTSSGVPLQPFIAAAPAPGSMPLAPGTSWRTYQPGQAPPGRAITPAEAAALSGRGDLGERLYLRGDFRVTASGENRAVLRDRSADGDAVAGAVRIIVEYPAGAIPPAESATFSRDTARPFEVRDVRRGGDGQINVYVREITAQ